MKINFEEFRKTVSKPCHNLGFCPYGVLVEDFPLERKVGISCGVFGHDCPVFHVAENLKEDIE